MPIMVRSERSHKRYVGVLGRRGVSGKIIRYFSKDTRATGRFLGVKLRVSFAKIVAFGGTEHTVRTLGVIPVSELVVRASYPCVTPRPCQNGQGYDNCICHITRGVTRVGKLAFSRITRVAARGTVQFFNVGWGSTYYEGKLVIGPTNKAARESFPAFLSIGYNIKGKFVHSIQCTCP